MIAYLGDMVSKSKPGEKYGAYPNKLHGWVHCAVGYLCFLLFIVQYFKISRKLLHKFIFFVVLLNKCHYFIMHAYSSKILMLSSINLHCSILIKLSSSFFIQLQRMLSLNFKLEGKNVHKSI
jgi:hypothetical protein